MQSTVRDLVDFAGWDWRSEQEGVRRSEREASGESHRGRRRKAVVVVSSLFGECLLWWSLDGRAGDGTRVSSRGLTESIVWTNCRQQCRILCRLCRLVIKDDITVIKKKLICMM